MDFLALVLAFFLGGATVIVVGINTVQSFFDGIREILDLLLG